MATLTPRLTLSGTAAHYGSAVNLSVDDALGTTNPFSGVSRTSIATSEQDIISDLTTSQSAVTYVYLKNTDANNAITIATGGSVDVCVLAPGEFMFMPLKGAVGLKATAASSASVLEYAYFTKA